jgi:signal transduction histidine kinase
MQKKIIIAITLQVIVIASTLGIISYITINESIDRLLASRLALARIIANDVEVFINNNLNRLYDISLSGKIDLRDGNLEPEKRMLETAYNYSPFTEGVFILDKHGNEILAYPPHAEYFSNFTHIDIFNQVLRLGKSVISNVYTFERTKQKVIFMIVPLWDSEGNVDGIVGGILSPTSHSINQLLHNTKVGENSFIDIIDSNEVVIASDNTLRVLHHHDRNLDLSRMIREVEPGIVECKDGCYADDKLPKGTDELLAFVPLTVAPWGVVIGQPEKEIFAPAISLRNKFILLVLIFIGTSIVFSFGMTKNIVLPLRKLITSTDKIASGDLSIPVGDLGSHEILTLSKSFDTMRQKLAESIERVNMHNIELENRVAARTLEIKESREKIEQLLKQSISTQEHERKRIARQLHDTILQDISAMLIKMDTIRHHNSLFDPDAIDDIKIIMINTIDNIYAVIKDLRPSIIDDLGIEASIDWLLNNHLKKKGITYYVDNKFTIKRRFPPEIEIALFRMLQEAIINVTRHSNAKNVFVTLEGSESHIAIYLKDDGIGFDTRNLKRHYVEDGRGLGILGMQERALLVNGELNLQSKPGSGTKVSIRIPLKTQEGYV